MGYNISLKLYVLIEKAYFIRQRQGKGILIHRATLGRWHGLRWKHGLHIWLSWQLLLLVTSGSLHATCHFLYRWEGGNTTDTPLRRLDTAHCWDGWTLYTSEKAVNYTPFLYGRDSLIVLCMLGRMQALVLCVPDEHIHVQLAALQK